MAAADIELIQPDWDAPARVRVVSSTRRGGASEGCYASLNVGVHVGDAAETVVRNRRLLLAALASPVHCCWLDQVHGVDIVEAKANASAAASAPRADASITDQPGLACAIMTADCLPVVFTDRDGRFVAAAHGGWRGIIGGVLEATVAAFAARSVPPGELSAWLGPAISAEAYEVDGAVIDCLTGADSIALGPVDNGHAHLDLVALARARLAAAGVTRVTGGDSCTYAEPERFFSFRRDGVCGRQVTMIWIDPGGA